MSIAPLCCSPVLAGPLPTSEADQLAAALKVLADPVRLRILGLIRQAPGQRARTLDLGAELGVTQPTVTHHLGALFDAGFVSRERLGRETWYAIVPASFEAVRQVFALDDGR
jgi:ArsR family transcriptional regulator